MTDDPFRTLVVEALNLTHPRFAAADAPGSFLREFYHQVRHLWDRAVPVQLGLGHVVVQADPDAPPGPRPDLLFWRLGEHGRPDERLGAVSLAMGADAAALDAAQMALSRYRKQPGYPRAVCVVIGGEAPEAPGIDVITFDVTRWQVVT